MFQHKVEQFKWLPDIRALVIDDNEFDRKRIKRVSGRVNLPIAVDEVQSLSELKHQLDQKQYDLFLIDYVLADSDGFEALEVIRNHHSGSNALTIMISGHDDQDIAVMALQKGIDDFIHKDKISSETLRASVVAAMKTSERFAHHYEQRNMMLDTGRIHQQLRLALKDPATRAILYAPIETDVLDAAQQVGNGLSRQSSPIITKFLTHLTLPEDFLFD